MSAGMPIMEFAEACQLLDKVVGKGAVLAWDFGAKCWTVHDAAGEVALRADREAEETESEALFRVLRSVLAENQPEVTE